MKLPRTTLVTPPRYGCGILWSTSLSVCLSVREHISGTAEPIGTKFCVQISCDRGSVLFRRRRATLCTSGCMDDVMFGRNGRYGETQSSTAVKLLPRAALRYRSGVWCLWMLVTNCFCSWSHSWTANISCTSVNVQFLLGMRAFKRLNDNE